jgi:hypothetical protein
MNWPIQRVGLKFSLREKLPPFRAPTNALILSCDVVNLSGAPPLRTAFAIWPHHPSRHTGGVAGSIPASPTSNFKSFREIEITEGWFCPSPVFHGGRIESKPGPGPSASQQPQSFAEGRERIWRGPAYEQEPSRSTRAASGPRRDILAFEATGEADVIETLDEPSCHHPTGADQLLSHRQHSVSDMRGIKTACEGPSKPPLGLGR